MKKLIDWAWDYGFIGAVAGTVIGLTVAQAQASAALHERMEKARTEYSTKAYTPEGRMLSRPQGELDQYAVSRASPDRMSIVFSSKRTALEYRDEAASNGERVCLTDLGAGRAHGQRYWLLSC